MPRLELRPVSIDDAPTIHALIRSAEVHDRFPLVTNLAEVEEYFAEPHFDPEHDARLALVDGEPAGWGRIWHAPSGEREERAYLSGTVDPRHRGKGVGTAVLEWQIERGTERLRAHPGDLPRHLRTIEYDWVSDALDLYRRHGFQEVRWMEELLRGLDAIPEVDSPDGVAIVAWNRAHDEAARVVKNTAFADHWGSTPTDAATWATWLEGHGTRLDLSFLALAGEEVVGYCLNEHYPDDEELLGRRDGWIGSLGVLREWRKRGVASALVVRSLRAFAGEGFTHASIGVDSDNPTGAAGLYRALGFEPQTRSITFQRTV
jgi:mycothiol synthase